LGIEPVLTSEGHILGHQISAHLPDRKSKTGFQVEHSIADIEESMWSGGIHELYSRLDCSDLDAGVSGAGDARKVPKMVVVAALKLYCQELLDGESVAAEVAFLAGCISGWPGKDKGIYICFA
jgi:hypothetical protein